jgi:hypothetical protein
MKLEGEARIVLREARSGQFVHDTGWSKNIVTDSVLLIFTEGGNLGSVPDIFIHDHTAPGNALRTMLPGVYANQSPSQVRTPDTIDLNATTAIAEYTVQFPAPAVARDINIVGLTQVTAVSANEEQLTGIIAYTTLTTTVTQGTSQTADVQYRITFSLQS